MTTSIYFSKFLVTKQVFYVSKYSYALVNLKPLVPGHVLVVPLRTSAISLSDLSAEENEDFFRTVQSVSSFIKHHFKADALNIAIQDGPEAGQTVPHLHTHIIPRYRANNFGDKIYEMVDNWTFESWQERRDAYLSAGGREGRRALAKPDDQRVESSAEKMEREARELSDSFLKFRANNSTD